MKNFIIGQHGGFDEMKYVGDFKDSFWGMEVCLFHDESDVVHLIQESQKRGFEIGVHFPFRAGRSHLRDALFLSQDILIK